MQQPILLEALCQALPELWSPRVVARVNDHLLKAVRIQGEFPWHTHAAEDELFLVLRGELRIGRAPADGGDVLLRAGECFVIPHGVRHCTAAAEETWMVLFEPLATAHTGDVVSPLTRSLAEQLEPIAEPLQPIAEPFRPVAEQLPPLAEQRQPLAAPAASSARPGESAVTGPDPVPNR